MNCLDARREMMADPDRPSGELQAHLAECPACAAAVQRTRDLNKSLRAALEVPAPEGLSDRLLLAKTTRHRSRIRRLGFALAASIALAAAGGVAWELGIRPVSEARALERYVVEHIHHEPEALTANEQVPREALEALLSEYGLVLAGGIDDVVFLRRCPTPEGTGVHFVVRTDQGPVTVIYLPQQDIDRRVAVESGDVEGYVERFGRGALALAGRPGQALDEVADAVHRAIGVEKG